VILGAINVGLDGNQMVNIVVQIHVTPADNRQDAKKQRLYFAMTAVEFSMEKRVTGDMLSTEYVKGGKSAASVRLNIKLNGAMNVTKFIAEGAKRYFLMDTNVTLCRKVFRN